MGGVGVKLRGLWRAMSVGILLVIYVALTSCSTPGVGAAPDPSAPENGPITVVITNTNPEVKMAIARVVETNETDSLDQGKLTLSACLLGQRISIWAPGYYIKSLTCSGASPTEYTVSLDLLNASDNPNYAWLDAEARYNSGLSCQNCHSGSSPELEEYVEWNLDGHSRVFVKPYFWTTYMGTDINGSPSQQTLWNVSQDGRRIRLSSDPMKPDFGPGYRSDYPNENGNCAFCHVPAAVTATQQGANLASVMNNFWGDRANVVTEGVTCDVCHKVVGVLLDDQNLPYIENPGILSFSFVRPSGGLQILTGPGSHLDTLNANFQRTCAPVFSESKFCAPCHYGKFSGVEIYASYKEWLDSSYSNKQNQNYRSCQDCHMAPSGPVGNTLAAERSACSESNQNFSDFNHNMMKYGTDPDNPSRTIPTLVKDAAMVTVDQIYIAGGQVTFNITVTNKGAGHKFPTDSPLRHLILVIEAKDMNNNPLMQVNGPMIPSAGDADYVGRAGQIYANLLKDKDTNSIPTIAYWNPVEPAWQGSDTRLLPGVPVQSQYAFAAPSHGAFTITARLIYRDVFYDIAVKKKWMPVDVEAAVKRVTINP